VAEFKNADVIHLMPRVLHRSSCSCSCYGCLPPRGLAEAPGRPEEEQYADKAASRVGTENPVITIFINFITVSYLGIGV
jgi:hypothetical protein